MPVEHRNIPDAQLHEPKGAASAPAGARLEAVGDGTTQWISTAVGGSVFGSAYFTENATETVISVIDTWVTINPTSFSLTAPDTMVFDTDHWIMPVDGVYSVNIDIAFSGGGGGGGNRYDFGFANNGTIIAASPKISRVTSSADIGAVSLSSVFSLSQNDQLSVQVKNVDAINNPTIFDISFTIVLLKAT